MNAIFVVVFSVLAVWALWRSEKDINGDMK